MCSFKYAVSVFKGPDSVGLCLALWVVDSWKQLCKVRFQMQFSTLLWNGGRARLSAVPNAGLGHSHNGESRQALTHPLHSLWYHPDFGSALKQSRWASALLGYLRIDLVSLVEGEPNIPPYSNDSSILKKILKQVLSISKHIFRSYFFRFWITDCVALYLSTSIEWNESGEARCRGEHMVFHGAQSCLFWNCLFQPKLFHRNIERSQVSPNELHTSGRYHLCFSNRMGLNLCSCGRLQGSFCNRIPSRFFYPSARVTRAAEKNECSF